jgi:hypothetical protein
MVAMALGAERTLTISETDQHELEVRWDQVWSRFNVSVDGSMAPSSVELLSLSKTKRWSLRGSEAEVHDVLIEKHRPLAAAAGHKQDFKVFVDAELVGEL